MIIRKLEIKGAGKKSAIVDLKSGLNVIAGASDTGKSYITKCFQFIFGAEDPPKSIEQVNGYTHLEVTFEENVGSSRFMLTRELKQKSDVVCKKIDKDNLPTILKPSHKGSPNLSNFFLGQFGLDGKVLVKGTESMKHVTLTMRIMEKVLLVDEERIISENSPLGKGQNTEKTQELSFLKTLLTGEDDSGILNAKKEKQSKTALRQKLENLENFLSQFFPKEDDVESTLPELDGALELLESSYERAEKELNELIVQNRELLVERNRLRSETNKLSRSITDDTSLLDRFFALREKYLSDRERLEAHSEATSYIEQQKIVNCPVCGNDFTQDDELDVDIILQSNASEISKIDLHLQDLESTIASVGQTVDKSKKILRNYLEEVHRIDSLLSEDIGTKLNENRSLLQDLDRARSGFRNKRDQEAKRQEILGEIGNLQVAYDEISDVYALGDFTEELRELSQKIADILVRWDFPGGKDTTFDANTRDIAVDGKPRSHYGKGYRAICFSAVILGLMDYLVPKGRHPGFVILDSPLTTYRKQDESADSENEEIYLANNLIYAFYRDLCDFYDNQQIIVLDNQEPDEDLHLKMNYIHFSHNEKIGRYGFFPVD